MFVNEYALVRTLGKGSFGKVKLGLNTHDHNLYALKLIPKSRRKFRGNPSGAPLVAEAEVIQEINVMKGLDHPNIVRLVEVIGECSGDFCLCLAFSWAPKESAFHLSLAKPCTRKKNWRQWYEDNRVLPAFIKTKLRAGCLCIWQITACGPRKFC